MLNHDFGCPNNSHVEAVFGELDLDRNATQSFAQWIVNTATGASGVSAIPFVKGPSIGDLRGLQDLSFGQENNIV